MQRLTVASDGVGMSSSRQQLRIRKLIESFEGISYIRVIDDDGQVIL